MVAFLVYSSLIAGIILDQNYIQLLDAPLDDLYLLKIYFIKNSVSML